MVEKNVTIVNKTEAQVTFFQLILHKIYISFTRSVQPPWRSIYDEMKNSGQI